MTGQSLVAYLGETTWSSGKSASIGHDGETWIQVLFLSLALCTVRNLVKPSRLISYLSLALIFLWDIVTQNSQGKILWSSQLLAYKYP